LAERAAELAARGRFAAAEDTARQALALDPANLDALLVAAEASLAAARPERALAYGSHALDVAPEHPTAQRAYGVGLHASGRWGESEQVWRTVLLRAPGNKQACLFLGAALTGQGRPDEARALAEVAALDADPGGESAARVYRGDLTWLGVAGAIVAAGVLLAAPGGFVSAGIALLVVLGAGYGVHRWRGRRHVPATADGRAAVARLDAARDRAVAGFAGALGVVVIAAWLLRTMMSP
jgi:tetratricopeptide (TPR) repeat protein